KILLRTSVITTVCGIMLANIKAETSRPALQNWPQWRGPLANGVAPLASPPTTWSETSHVKWKVKIPGSGSATPVLWDKKVFIQTAIPTGKKTETPAVKSDGSPPAPEAQPANQPGRRRGVGGFGGGEKPTEVHQFVVLCLDRLTGKVLWQKTAREELPH